MIEIREEIKPVMWWQIKCGNSSFWFDNWTKSGALYYLEGEDAIEEELEVKEFISNSSWLEGAIRSKVSTEMTDFIIQDIKPEVTDQNDLAM